MKICTARLKSVSAYSQSRMHQTPKLDKESADAYEHRTWREKCHYDDNGKLFIPGMSFKMALDSAAKFLGLKIPGRKNSTYTKHFLSGVLVLENAPIDAMKDTVAEERLYVNADGVRGSGKRVWRSFPIVHEWETELCFHVADETITKDIFEDHLREAGKFIGVGRFRPQSGGFKGRFEVADLSWS